MLDTIITISGTLILISLAWEFAGFLCTDDETINEDITDERIDVPTVEPDTESEDVAQTTSDEPIESIQGLDSLTDPQIIMLAKRLKYAPAKKWSYKRQLSDHLRAKVRTYIEIVGSSDDLTPLLTD